MSEFPRPPDDGYHYLLEVPLGNFVIESLTDVDLLFQELQLVADEYPGYVPFIKVIDW